MATDVERLVLQLSADLRTFERQMVAAAGSADRAAQRIERRFQQQNRRVVQDFNTFGDQVRTILATVGVGLVVRDVVALSDAWTRVGNSLAFAGIEGEQLAAVQQVVADIASRTRSDLEATAELFGRMLRSSEDLGASLGEVAAATEIVSKALAGASQSERAGAIRQLGQALSAGTLAGDELRSILENSRVLAEAIADEFGVGVGQLRALGKAGELESRRVFEAILNAGDEIEATFARVTFTVADEFVRLRTEAARFVGTSEKTSQATRSLAGFIKLVADNFSLLASATIVVATALGGAFAGVAVQRAITALTSLQAGAITTTRVLNLLAASVLPAVGIGLALLATNTDFFTSAAERAARASNSLYSALQVIVSLGERLEETAVEGENAAAATEALGDAAGEANAALGEAGVTLGETAGQLGIVERASRGLAEAEKQRAIATLAAALADQQAAIAAARRQIVFNERQSAGLGGGRFGVPQDVLDRNDARRREQNRLLGITIIQAQEGALILADALDAVRTINSEFFAPAEASGIRREAGLTADELERAARAADALKERLVSGQAAKDAAVALEGERESRDLEIELQLARARGDEEAIRNLERRLEIEQRIAELRRLGIEGDEATTRAEAGVAALEAADMEGKFRDWFRGGIMAALDGDLGDFFENWLKERAAKGLEDALNQVADLIIAIFRQAGSSTGGGNSGGGWADALASVIGSFFGGGRAGGGAVSPGKWYMTGERGPEPFIPSQPGVIIPNGALAGGGGVTVVDNTVINITGASFMEVQQLRGIVQRDIATRQQQIVAGVNDAFARRQILRR